MNNVSRQPFDDGEEEGGRRESEKERETETETEREREREKGKTKRRHNEKEAGNKQCVYVCTYIYVCTREKK